MLCEFFKDLYSYSIYIVFLILLKNFLCNSDHTLSLAHMESLRIIVTGASGMLGRAVVEMLSAQKSADTVQFWALSRAGDKYKKINITDNNELRCAVMEFKVHMSKF